MGFLPKESGIGMTGIFDKKKKKKHKPLPNQAGSGMFGVSNNPKDTSAFSAGSSSRSPLGRKI